MKRLVLAATAALFAFAGAATAQAQTYPSRPITMVVPFAAGGPTDTVARLVADAMGRNLGQEVIVQNVGGAGGTLGAAQAADADPDGYTILLHHIGLATAATLYRSLPYDTLTAFAPIGEVTDVPMTLISRPGLPVPNGDLQALITYVKANAATITMANAGIGSASHLCGLLFQSAIGTTVTTVPYTGTGPAMTDILAGNVDIMCDQTTNTITQITSNAVQAYAVTSPERLSVVPDLKTATEQGLPELTVGVWHGLYAPAGTPQPIVDRLEQALQFALADQTVIDRFAALATAPVAMDEATPEALGALLASEVAKWQPLIVAAGDFAN